MIFKRGSPLYLEYFIHGWCSEINIKLSYCLNIPNDMKYLHKQQRRMLFGACNCTVLGGPNKLLMNKNGRYDAKFIKRHIFRYEPATRIIVSNH